MSVYVLVVHVEKEKNECVDEVRKECLLPNGRLEEKKKKRANLMEREKIGCYLHDSLYSILRIRQDALHSGDSYNLEI